MSDNSRGRGTGSQPTAWQLPTGVVLGVLLIVTLVWLNITHPDLSHTQCGLVRVLLGIAAGGVGAILPGAIETRIPGVVTRSAGALGLVVLVIAIYDCPTAQPIAIKPSGKTDVVSPQGGEPGLPTRAAAQISQLTHDYSIAQDRIRKIDDIINNKNTTYSYLDDGRLAYYTKAKAEQQRFVDDALAAEEELKRGKSLDNLPSLPGLSLAWPEPTASATYTLWHDNHENNNFTVLYVTVWNGFAQGIKLRRPDGTFVQLDTQGSAVPELVSPPLEWQNIDGIRVLAIERMAFMFPGHQQLAGSTVEVTSRQGKSFASATVGQPTNMTR